MTDGKDGTSCGTQVRARTLEDVLRLAPSWHAAREELVRGLVAGRGELARDAALVLSAFVLRYRSVREAMVGLLHETGSVRPGQSGAEPEVRAIAARSLGPLVSSDASVRYALVSALLDEDEHGRVREAAAFALAEGAPSPTVLGALRTALSGGAVDAATRALAVTAAMSHLGHAMLVDELCGRRQPCERDMVSVDPSQLN